MTKYLFTVDADYADEFYVKGFSLGTEKDKEMYDYVKNNLDKLDECWDGEYTVGFGSNEEIEFDSVSEFLEHIEPTEITDEEYNTISKVLGDEYGLVYPLDNLRYLYDEMSD